MKYILILIISCSISTAYAQTITKAEVDARMAEITKRGKTALKQPVKPIGGAKWLIGKWIAKENWTDKNDNNVMDGKEKSDGENTMTIEFKADGTACFTANGMPAVCNSNWAWGTATGKMIWFTDKFFGRVYFMEVMSMTENGFVAETDRYTKTKKGISTFDANKQHDKTLFEKQADGKAPIPNKKTTHKKA